MTPYDRQAIAAGEKLAALMEKPMPESAEDFGWGERFDPWEFFRDSLYGTYSGAFDTMALTVLGNLASGKVEGETLAHEMFREILCTSGLCDYGTSPRVCFPTSQFKALLPELIRRWEGYYRVMWNEEVPA